jgi:hypothetical protein
MEFHHSMDQMIRDMWKWSTAMTAENQGDKGVAVATPPEVRTSGVNNSARASSPGPRGAPAGRMTTATAIYRELHAAIVAMEMTPGTALNEKVLTERFGVSRTPVREALIRLVEDGLVDVFPQSGTFVARIPVALIPVQRPSQRPRMSNGSMKSSPASASLPTVRI